MIHPKVRTPPVGGAITKPPPIRHPVATRGSHRQYKHPTFPGRVTIPHPNKDLPRGTVQSILKQAGLK